MLCVSGFGLVEGFLHKSGQLADLQAAALFGVEAESLPLRVQVLII